MTTAVRSILRKRIRDHRVGTAAVAEKSAAGSSDYNVLLTVLSLKSDWRRMRPRVELCDPQLLARFGIERAEAAVVCGADEDQPACRGQRSADVRPARVLLFGWKILADPERGLPRDV